MGSAVSVGCKPDKARDFNSVVTRHTISQQRDSAAPKSESTEPDDSYNYKLYQVIDEGRFQIKTVNKKIPAIDEDGFQVLHLVDTGGFGFVFKAIRNVTRQTYALKVQPMEFMTHLTRAGGTRPVTKNTLHVERNALVECRGHPFIVRLEYAFCTKLYAVLAMEYIQGGTLSRLITSFGTLPSAVAKIYTADTKITDFGLAGSLVAGKEPVNPQESMLETTSSNEHAHCLSCDEESISSEEPEISKDETDTVQCNIKRVRRRTLCGTAGFRPPEQVGERFVDYYRRSGYDEKADYFSLGVTTFTMVAGRRPFPSRKEITQSVTGISSPSPSGRRSSITGVSALEMAAIRKGMRDIEFQSTNLLNMACPIKKCLMSEVSYPENLEHDGKEVIMALLERNPNERPHLESLKAHRWFSGIEFNPLHLKQVSMPEWITYHAAIESNPKKVRRSSTASHRKPKKDVTVSLFIKDICAEMIDIGSKVDAECAVTRWTTSPSPQTLKLFQGWEFVSEEANAKEINAVKQNRQIGFMSRVRSRRGTTFI
eukprot:CCRYP_016533-RA/>CCRYP_016533-RA protein AED:0.62 eAED:0.27 QI:0/0/0/0.75/0.33/0.75/4/0/540